MADGRRIDVSRDASATYMLTREPNRARQTARFGQPPVNLRVSTEDERHMI